MSKNNDVFKTLFLPNDVAQTSGTRSAALTNGDWGVFDYDTGLSVTATTAAAIPGRFYIAYKGDGTLGVAGELYTTSGSHIQLKNVSNLTINNDNVATDQTLTVSAMEAQSGASATNYDYGIKFDFRGNTDVYQRFGANQASKFAMANTKCVGTGTASDDADAEVVAQWAESLANDVDQFIGFSVAGTGITNTPVVYTASGTMGTSGSWADSVGAITEAVALAQIRLYATTSTDLATVFTINSFSSMYSFCNVNPKYFKMRGIRAIPSLLGGTCAWGTFAETVSIIYEEGRGYDVQELEYLAGGFTGDPGVYRQSRLNGLPFTRSSFLAVSATFYTVCALEYAQFSIGGWQEYLNNQSTYIILPDTVTNTAGFPVHVLGLIASAAGAPSITT